MNENWIVFANVIFVQLGTSSSGTSICACCILTNTARGSCSPGGNALVFATRAGCTYLIRFFKAERSRRSKAITSSIGSNPTVVSIEVTNTARRPSCWSSGVVHVSSDVSTQLSVVVPVGTRPAIEIMIHSKIMAHLMGDDLLKREIQYL